ncbi:MAG: class I SAM-dependent methyltransferase [Polyangiaceae bacterium]|nr:class I SAM-dependent methyltransferase [Polyangiaceae bacterium]
MNDAFEDAVSRPATAAGGRPRRLQRIAVGAGLLLGALITAVCVGRSWIKAVFYIDHMERPERVDVLQVSRVVQSLGLRSGQKVADIGAGSGLLTRPIARIVAPGAAYAIDINARLLEHVAARARAEGLDNVRTMLATEHDPKLSEAVDLIFLCDTLHYIETPDRYVQRFSKLVVPNGRVAIIHFVRNWPPMSHQFSAAELDQWMHQAGFALTEEHDFLPDRTFRIYTAR